MAHKVRNFIMFLMKEKKNEYSSISRGRQDSSYSRDRESYREREREREEYTEDYSDTDIQSGLTEARTGDQGILGFNYVGI